MLRNLGRAIGKGGGRHHGGVFEVYSGRYLLEMVSMFYPFKVQVKSMVLESRLIENVGC